MSLNHTNTLCGRGPGRDKFRRRLAGVAIGEDGRRLVVGDEEVKVFSAEGRLLRRVDLGDRGWSVAADGGQCWVGFRGELRAFDAAGTETARIADQQRLGRVTAIGVTDKLLVLGDATNRIVRVYSRAGSWIRNIGEATNRRGFFIPNGVWDLAVDRKSGTFVVAHPGKHRVERYRLDGTLVGKFGRFGMQRDADFPGCCNPTNVGLMPNGSVIVTEKAKPRLKTYSPDGDLLDCVASEAFDPMTKNMDIAAAGNGRVYVTDPAQLVVHVFEPAQRPAAVDVDADNVTRERMKTTSP